MTLTREEKARILGIDRGKWSFEYRWSVDVGVMANAAWIGGKNSHRSTSRLCQGRIVSKFECGRSDDPSWLKNSWDIQWHILFLSYPNSTYAARARRNSKRLPETLIRLLMPLWCFDKVFCAPLKISSPIFSRSSIFDPFSHARGHIACWGNFVRTRCRMLLTTNAVSGSSWMTLDISCGIAV